MIAYLLTDTEAETYFKNFLLSDHCKKYYRPKTRDYSPVEYTKLLISKQKELVDDEDYEDELMRPQDAEAKLFDLTTCTNMVFEPHGKRDDDVVTGLNGISVATSSQKAESYTIRLQFNHFFQDIEQAEYGALIFKDAKTDAEYLDSYQFIEQKKEGSELVLKVEIPRKYRKIGCQLMIVVRLVIDADRGLYFPYPMVEKQERWLAARVPIFNHAAVFIPEDFMSSEHIKYDTLENLTRVSFWQNWIERLLNGTN